jgi:hypothetical protein
VPLSSNPLGSITLCRAPRHRFQLPQAHLDIVEFQRLCARSSTLCAARILMTASAERLIAMPSPFPIPCRICLLVFPARVMNVVIAVITAKRSMPTMTTFTIDTDNNITAHTSPDEGAAVAGAERFSTTPELAELAANWPAERLVEIWNSLPGVTPVERFKDPKTAVGRIWKRLQGLGQPAEKATRKAAAGSRRPKAASSKPKADYTVRQI